MVYAGVLAFSVAPDGVIAGGSLTPLLGDAMAVTGQAAGRAIDIQVELAADQLLVLSGLGEQSIADCSGPMAGLFSGPQPGDLGTWSTVTENSAGSSMGGSAGSSAGPTPTGSTGSSALCPPPSFPCGPNCCPAGSTCTDQAAGLCPCPDGTEQCGNACVPSCPGGELLDLDTCQCPEVACTPENGTCDNHGQCCTGYCGGGTCFTCTGRICGDFGCIDPAIDSQNCGNCGNVCIAPQTCLNGACQVVCKTIGMSCDLHLDCCTQDCRTGICGDCSNLPTDSANCGICGIVCET
jgi:hypothetical protein